MASVSSEDGGWVVILEAIGKLPEGKREGEREKGERE